MNKPPGDLVHVHNWGLIPVGGRPVGHENPSSWVAEAPAQNRSFGPGEHSFPCEGRGVWDAIWLRIYLSYNQLLKRGKNSGKMEPNLLKTTTEGNTLGDLFTFDRRLSKIPRFAPRGLSPRRTNLA